MQLSRREWMAAAGGSCLARQLAAAEDSRHSFWVFKLLDPRSVRVRPWGTNRLHCSAEGEHWELEGAQSLTYEAGAAAMRITGPAGAAAGCVLEVPGVMRRVFIGTVEISSQDDCVIPVVTMDCECATGSIVGAELPVGRCALSGLAAQAVVSRSILCADGKPRHAVADFCDTTHCQFLRSPAALDGRVWRATEATKNRVLMQQGRIFPARYSAACGGETESGMDGEFRYQRVECAVCRQKGTVRRGHGWGLCQEGAMELAARGWTWERIVAHYYPNSYAGQKSM